MNGDYSALAQAFQRQRPQGQPRGGMMGGAPRPMGQMPGGVPGPGGIMDGQRPQRPDFGMGPRPGQPPMHPQQSPQQAPGFGQFGGNIPRPMGGGIMGGQPQAPRPMQAPVSMPTIGTRRPY